MAFSDSELSALAVELGRALVARGEAVATAESCTGGWIAKVLTDVAGSSRWFGTGIVSYSNLAKSRLLAVPPVLFRQDGAVSEPVVRAMVHGCLAHADADWAVAVSGVAGPGGGTDEKPVGTVWLAVGHKAWQDGDILAEVQHFSGDRERVRRQTVARALDLLTEQLNRAS